MAAQLALLAASSAAKLIGGAMSAARAKARGEFLASQVEEQAQLYKFSSSRELTNVVGTGEAQAVARNVAGGSVTSSIIDSYYDAKLQQQTKLQAFAQQAEEIRMNASVSAVSELGKAAASALELPGKQIAESSKK